MSYHKGRIRKLHKAKWVLYEKHNSTETWLCAICGWSKIRFSKAPPKRRKTGMLFTYQITVEAEKQTGKFVSRDEIGDEIAQAIEDADPGNVDIDESTYDIVTWEVTEVKTEK